MGISRLQVVHKILHLQVLAAQAQHGNAAHIRVVGIGRQQFAEQGGILAGSTAAALVVQELDAVHILKQTVRFHHRFFYAQIRPADVRTPGIQLDQQLHFLFVLAGNGIAQCVVQRLANDIQVAVLAENGGNKEPVVGGTHAAIAAVVTIESATGKFAYVRGCPLVLAGPVNKRVGGVLDVAGGH